MSRGDPQFKLRMSGPLLEAVKAQAQHNRRSMNAEIVLMIERALEITHSDLPSCSEAQQPESPCQG
ncbi:Arc family DNA-binding protein [Bordetella trematum]|uniref:Arc family DNA-binding protein n=1 Tax=Bordetella trematum TaxID=123899 RepID=UPI00047268D4